jgi:hypothetical protein
VIPKTTTYKQFKEKKARDEAEAAAAAAQPGQTNLQNGVNGQVGSHHSERAVGHEKADLGRAAESSNSRTLTIVNGSPIADRTVSSAPHGHPGAEDVEMQG